jgi:hypothetical protein
MIRTRRKEFKRYKLLSDGVCDCNKSINLGLIGGVYRNIGNVTINCITSSSKNLFENKGDVIIDRTNKANSKLMLFNNEGNVNVKGFTKLKGEWIFNNTGDVEIDKEVILNENCKFRNGGNVILHTKKMDNSADIKNCGDIINLDATRIEDYTVFVNKGDVVMPNLISTGNYTEYRNGGHIKIESPNIRIGRYNLFINGGNVILGASNILMGTDFANGGSVKLPNVVKLDSAQGRFVVRNGMDFSMPNLETLNVFCVRFNNGGNVVLHKLKEIKRDIVFNNGGTVYLEKLTQSPSKMKFHNICDVHIESFIYNKQTHITATCKGSVYANKSPKSIAKHMRCGGYIITNEGTIYSKKSYFKRYKVYMEDGVFILYKSVSKFLYRASYDKSNVSWRPGETNIIENPDIYSNEIGKGKFVGFATPELCDTIGTKKEHRYIAIQVNIVDCYEWLYLPKYPQCIGFTKGTVLYECDIHGKEIKQTKRSQMFRNRMQDCQRVALANQKKLALRDTIQLKEK